MTSTHESEWAHLQQAINNDKISLEELVQADSNSLVVEEQTLNEIVTDQLGDNDEVDDEEIEESFGEVVTCSEGLATLHTLKKITGSK